MPLKVVNAPLDQRFSEVRNDQLVGSWSMLVLFPRFEGVKWAQDLAVGLEEAPPVDQVLPALEKNGAHSILLVGQALTAPMR